MISRLMCHTLQRCHLNRTYSWSFSTLHSCVAQFQLFEKILNLMHIYANGLDNTLLPHPHARHHGFANTSECESQIPWQGILYWWHCSSEASFSASQLRWEARTPGLYLPVLSFVMRVVTNPLCLTTVGVKTPLRHICWQCVTDSEQVKEKKPSILSKHGLGNPCCTSEIMVSLFTNKPLLALSPHPHTITKFVRLTYTPQISARSIAKLKLTYPG